MVFPLITFRTVDFEQHSGEVRFDVADFKMAVSGEPFALVPPADLATAFASLQDAGEAAGCPVGKDIIGFIGGQRSLFAEFVSDVEALLNTSDDTRATKLSEKLEDMVLEYNAARAA